METGHTDSARRYLCLLRVHRAHSRGARVDVSGTIGDFWGTMKRHHSWLALMDDGEDQAREGHESTDEDQGDSVTRPAYKAMHLRLTKALGDEGDFDVREADQEADQDWVRGAALPETVQGLFITTPAAAAAAPSCICECMIAIAMHSQMHYCNCITATRRAGTRRQVNDVRRFTDESADTSKAWIQDVQTSLRHASQASVGKLGLEDLVLTCAAAPPPARHAPRLIDAYAAVRSCPGIYE